MKCLSIILYPKLTSKTQTLVRNECIECCKRYLRHRFKSMSVLQFSLYFCLLMICVGIVRNSSFICSPFDNITQVFRDYNPLFDLLLLLLVMSEMSSFLFNVFYIEFHKTNANFNEMWLGPITWMQTWARIQKLALKEIEVWLQELTQPSVVTIKEILWNVFECKCRTFIVENNFLDMRSVDRTVGARQLWLQL